MKVVRINQTEHNHEGDVASTLVTTAVGQKKTIINETLDGSSAAQGLVCSKSRLSFRWHYRNNHRWALYFVVSNRKSCQMQRPVVKRYHILKDRVMRSVSTYGKTDSLTYL